MQFRQKRQGVNPKPIDGGNNTYSKHCRGVIYNLRLSIN